MGTSYDLKHMIMLHYFVLLLTSGAFSQMEEYNILQHKYMQHIRHEVGDVEEGRKLRSGLITMF